MNPTTEPPYKIVEHVAFIQVAEPTTENSDAPPVEVQLRHAAENPDVSAICLCLSSPVIKAWEGDAMTLLQEVALKKSMVAAVDGDGASAAYWVAGQALDGDLRPAVASPPPFQPRRVRLYLIYAAQRGTRTGKTYPAGPHIRGEIRDALTGEILYRHKANMYTRSRMRAYAEKQKWNVVGRRWAVGPPNDDTPAAKGNPKQ